MGLISKCERALVAYFQANGVGGQIVPYATNVERTLTNGGNVTIWVHNGRPSAQYTGNWDFDVQIDIEYLAAQQPDETNREANRVAFDALTESVEEACMQVNVGDIDLRATARLITEAGWSLAVLPDGDNSDDAKLKQANNLDMAAFACLWWREQSLDGGNANPDASAYKQTMTFVMTANSLASSALPPNP